MSETNKTNAPQKVDYNEAVAESKVYFGGDDLAATVWVSKYALKDSFGNIYENHPARCTNASPRRSNASSRSTPRR